MIFCGHNGYFLADIMQVEGAWVVRANGPVTPSNIIRQDVEQVATHHVMDMYGGFWRPDLGVFVVPDKGLILTEGGKQRLKEMKKFRKEQQLKKAA